MNAAIITARAGSKSIEDKNVYPVRGKPLMAYPIEAAQHAELIDEVFVSTDGESISEVGERMGCETIWRPDEFRVEVGNHGDVIKHAVEYVDAHRPDLRNVVILLGNVVMLDGELIDECLRVLDEREDVDSVMTVWEAADDHPFRALQVVDGLVRPFPDQPRDIASDRQTYPKVYYYDQGVWALRKECVQTREGPSPWWWMGKRCHPIVREWVTGRDIHSFLDMSLAEWWLEHCPDTRHS